MTFGGFIFLLFFLTFLVWMLRVIFGGPMCYAPYIDDDYEEVTTTTTTTQEQPHYNVAGNLRRQYTEGDKPQAYVIDPHDQEKQFLNSNDDMYEDGAGKIWRLVG